MPLNKPNQELRRNLKAAEFELRHVDTLALMMLISRLYAGYRIGALADELKVGVITKAKAE